MFATLVATSAYGQVSLGVRGGYINSEIVSTGTNHHVGTSASDNWTVGAYANIPLFSHWYLQPGIDYTQKGATMNFGTYHPDFLFTTDVTKLKLQYLEVPVNLVYKINTGIGKIVLGGGPYAAYAAGGNYHLVVYNSGKKVQSNDQKINFGSPNILGTDVDLKRWDAGANGTLGIEFNCYLSLSVHYSRGFVDIDKSGNNFKNQYWGIKLGVMLDREDW